MKLIEHGFQITCFSNEQLQGALDFNYLLAVVIII